MKTEAVSEDRTLIRLLGRLLGEVIREQHGPQALALVEDIRRRSVGDYRAAAEGTLETLLAGLDHGQMLLLIRAFSIFAQLANIADDHESRRATRALGSVAARRLELSPALTGKRVRAFLEQASFVPVITAH